MLHAFFGGDGVDEDGLFQERIAFPSRVRL